MIVFVVVCRWKLAGDRRVRRKSRNERGTWGFVGMRGNGHGDGGGDGGGWRKWINHEGPRGRRAAGYDDVFNVLRDVRLRWQQLCVVGGRQWRGNAFRGDVELQRHWGSIVCGPCSRCQAGLFRAERRQRCPHCHRPTGSAAAFCIHINVVNVEKKK